MTSFEKFKKAYQGKKVLVMGLGLLGGGVGVAKVFSEIGAQVTVTDLRNEKKLLPSLKKLIGLRIKFVLGKHQKNDFLGSDLVVRNPGVPQDSPFLKLAKKKDIPIVMDTSLFARFCGRPIIGITGTRGKTTTATLIYELLKAAGKNALLGGNVKGVATLALLKKIKPNSIVVLELSSWELQGFDQEKISPHIALITNIYPDHLNRYQNMKDYITDKKVIFKYQKRGDYLVLNQENKLTREMAAEARAKVIWFRKEDVPGNWQIKLPGKHNRENAAASYQVGKIFKISFQAMKVVFETFAGVEYRLQEIAEINDVKYINDTTSTIPQATMAALAAIDRPIILLTGGSSKNLDLTDLAKAIVKETKAVVLLEGTATDELVSLINRNGGGERIIGRFDNLNRAVMAARQVAKDGDVVLLSPGCASFGMFENEYDRGEQFNQIVKSLC